MRLEHTDCSYRWAFTAKIQYAILISPAHCACLGCYKRIKLIKVKVIPQQAELARGVPGMLRPRIFLTFDTTRVVGRQPYAPAAFTPGKNPGTHFQRLSRPQGTWFLRGEPRKKSPVTPPGIDPGTVWLVAQCLNHCATPGPFLLLDEILNERQID